MIQNLRNSEFIRSVATLMTGTVLAQLIAFLAYPIITRIYSEQDIGELGLYTRFVAFIAALATARYDFAMPITKRDSHAFSLFRLSLRIAFVCLFSVLIFGMCYAIFQPDPDQYFLFIILAVGSAYATVWINIGTNWAIRTKAFKTISQQRIVNALGVSSFRLLFGWFKLGAFGILLGSFIGTIASSFVFVLNYLKLKKEHKPSEEKKRMRVVAKTYREFPGINLPHVLLDLGVDWVLAMSIAVYFDKGQLGQYSHAFLMMKLPLSVIGQSVGQVFFNKGSMLVNEGKSVLPFATKTVKTLLLISVIPFALIFFFGDDLFAFVFGAKWRESGEFAEILVPYLFLNFLLSPVSSLPLILGRQSEMLMIGIIVALVQLFSFLLLPYLNMDLKSVLWVNSLSLSVVLIIVMFVYRSFAKAGRK